MNKIDLANRRAVITGGAQGIGFSVAERFVKSGATVAIWDCDAVLGASAADRLGAEFFQLDQADPQAVTQVTAQTQAKLGGIDVLVACAGIAGANAPVVDYPIDEWQRIIDINLNGLFYLNKAVVGGMIAQNYGRIINVSSIAGKEGNPNASAYSASKAGVIALTKSLSKETADKNIAVNCVTPAAARTRIFDQMSEEHIAYMLSKIPRGRFLEVEEAAAMVAWLASEENSFTTGAVFDLSGGRATY